VQHAGTNWGARFGLGVAARKKAPAERPGNQDLAKSGLGDGRATKLVVDADTADLRAQVHDVGEEVAREGDAEGIEALSLPAEA